MNDFSRLEEALFQVLEDLEPFLPSLVLIGGWVPLLYRNYLWKSETIEPAYTTDIDFGIPTSSKNLAKKTIYSQLSQLKYLEKHIKMGNLYPVAFRVKTSKKDESLPVEFITGDETPRETIEKLLGREIHIHRVDHFDWLVKNPISIRLNIGNKKATINIPSPERYVIHKLLIYPQRENKDKANKDAFTVYYVLRFHPEPDDLLKSIKKLDLKKEMEIAKHVLTTSFNSRSAKGILQIEKEIGFQISISDIRQDIFQTFDSLRRAIS